MKMSKQVKGCIKLSFIHICVKQKRPCHPSLLSERVTGPVRLRCAALAL